MPDNGREFVYRALEAGRITQEEHDVLRHSWDESIQLRQRMRRRQVFRTIRDVGRGRDFVQALADYLGLDLAEFIRLFGADWWPAPKKYQIEQFREPGEWLPAEDLAHFWVFAGRPLTVVVCMNADSVDIGPPGVLESGEKAYGSLVEIDLEAEGGIDRAARRVSQLRAG